MPGSASTPLSPGISMSSRTTSGDSSTIARRAAPASPTERTAWPCAVTRSTSASRVPGSSSTTRIFVEGLRRDATGWARLSVPDGDVEPGAAGAACRPPPTRPPSAPVPDRRRRAQPVVPAGRRACRSCGGMTRAGFRTGTRAPRARRDRLSAPCPTAGQLTPFPPLPTSSTWHHPCMKSGRWTAGGRRHYRQS